MTTSPLHCGGIWECRRKWAFAVTQCFSVLMKREIEGRKAFIFWENAMPAHEYLPFFYCQPLFCVKNLLKGTRSCLREHREKVWSVAVNHLEEIFVIQVTWERFITLQRKDQSHRKHNINTTTAPTFLFLLVPQFVGQTIYQLNLMAMLCGNSWGNQTSGCLPGQKFNKHIQSACNDVLYWPPAG